MSWSWVIHVHLRSNGPCPYRRETQAVKTQAHRDRRGGDGTMEAGWGVTRPQVGRDKEPVLPQSLWTESCAPCQVTPGFQSQPPELPENKFVTGVLGNKCQALNSLLRACSGNANIQSLRGVTSGFREVGRPWCNERLVKCSLLRGPGHCAAQCVALKFVLDGIFDFLIANYLRRPPFL